MPKTKMDPLLRKTRKSTRTRNQQPGGGCGEETPLPALHEVPRGTERDRVIIEKLRRLRTPVDFMDPSVDPEIKTGMLRELVEAVNQGEPLNEKVASELIETVSSNILRYLPPSEPVLIPIEEATSIDDDDCLLDPSWPYLDLVYDLLLGFLDHEASSGQGNGRKLIDKRLVTGLFRLFDSEDPREREKLKSVVHKLYSKYLWLRPVLRRNMSDAFLTLVDEGQRLSGAAELLEVLGSIVNGFAVPLRSEHVTLLLRVLMPLHKTKSMASFHPQLAYCVVQYVEKQPDLAVDVIKALLRYWPKTCGRKEVLFLGELEDLLEVVEPSVFPKFMIPLFQRIAISASSTHYQVAERALGLWSNEAFLSLVMDNNEKLMPVMFGSLFRTSKEHWNPSVVGLASTVLAAFMHMNHTLFDKLTLTYRQTAARNAEQKTRKEIMWKKIESLSIGK